MFSPILLGASGRVARRVRRAWALDGTVAPHCVARRAGPGIDTLWDMTRDRPAALDRISAASTPADRRPVVISFAGVTHHRSGNLDDNQALALAALDAADAWGGHLLVFSTAAVYGPTPRDGACETTPLDPRSPYGRSKQAMEHSVLTGPDRRNVTVLRLGNVAGAGQPFDAVAQDAPLHMHRFGDSTGPSRSYIGPQTLARVLYHLGTRAAQGGSLPDVLNVAAPVPTAMADIVRALDRPFDWVAAPPDALPWVHLDVSRLLTLCALDGDAGSAARLVGEVARTGDVA